MKSAINTKIQWLEFALSQLVKYGPERLKIAPLCDAKGVTKGSFYHHFKNRQVFIDALMEHWYQEMTIDFIRQANSEGTPLQRLEKLDQVIAGTDIEAEMHIRAWALKDKSIASHLEKIDQQRQNYLSQCYVQLGLDETLANDIAMIGYANFLGMQQLHPKPDAETVKRLAALAFSKFIKEI